MANTKKKSSADTTKKPTVKKKNTASKKTANNKKTTNKKTGKSSKKLSNSELERKKALQGEILSIVLIGLSLIMFVCVLTNKNTGTFGHYISSFLITSFGIGATVLPIVLFVFSIQTLMSDQKSKFKGKLFLFLGFFIVFISLAYVMTGADIKHNSTYDFIYYYYEHASLSNGGIIGAITGGLLHAAIGSIGSYIVLLTALIVLLILATGKSVVGFINYVGDMIDGVKEDLEEIAYNEEFYEEDEEEEIPQKRSKKKKESVQLELPMDEAEKPSDFKMKPVKKAKNKKASDRVVTFNITDEEPTADDDLLFENDFILKNNAIYNKPKNPDINFTGLQTLVNEASQMQNGNREHYVYNLENDNEISETDTEEINESLVSDISDDISHISDIKDKTPVEEIDEPPFEPDDNSDIIAKKALLNINKPKTVVQNSYSAEDAPEIIEAEKTKDLSRLKVEKTTTYSFPKLEFLGKNPKLGSTANRDEMLSKAKQLENTLNIFNVAAKVNNISQGPAVTRYELTPPKGVRVKDIVNLENDIALALAARSIRMEAPIPGKSAIGIEIPNDTISMVYFREVLTNEKFQNFKGKIAFGIGKDITGNVIVQDIAKMPHLLIAGSTGSGKSVCINTLITSILYKYSPDKVKLIMIDPKIVELGVYNGIPHLLVPVVTDPQKAAGALNWAVREMMRRYDVFATRGVRNLEGYNEIENIEEKLPQIVVIIDELADLMMVAKKDVEASIQRLTQLARAAGIHLIIATQRPSVNVITGVIKANVPSRIAFKVASSTDSRTILDASGAEKLLGKGDMLFQAGDMDKPLRIQGAFVTDHEIEQIVNHIRISDEDHYDQSIISEITSSGSDNSSSGGGTDGSSDDSDEIINEVIRFVVSSGKASTSLIQRKFRIGFNRAARIIDELEERGIIGPDKGGTKGRDVLMDKYELNEWSERQQNY